MQLTASELADKIGLSKGRITQLVTSGKLAGCFVGEGRNRRFDLDKSVRALKGGLDRAQMLGNGAETKRRLGELSSPAAEGEEAPRSTAPRSDSPLLAGDSDRYELARAAKAEEDLRAMRLRNGREEGLYVYASEVERQVASMLSQEIAEFENVLRDGARAVADQLGVDFKAARKILIDHWRQHRAKRSTQLAQDANGAELLPTEQENDI